MWLGWGCCTTGGDGVFGGGLGRVGWFFVFLNLTWWVSEQALSFDFNLRRLAPLGGLDRDRRYVSLEEATIAS